jgi:hypothetical protein
MSSDPIWRRSILPLRHPELLRRPAIALLYLNRPRAPNPRVLLHAMLADQLIWRNLDLATALAPQIDGFASAQVIEGRVGAIDEA